MPSVKLGNLVQTFANLAAMDDGSLEDVQAKEKRYAELVGSTGYQSARLLADAWCAAFVWKKDKTTDDCITESWFHRIEANPHCLLPWMKDEIARLRDQYQFFHWHLAFPDAFRVPSDEESPENEQTGWNGGFDIVLGNPPWEKMKLQEREFFAVLDPAIATARTSADRKKLIAAHRANDTLVWHSYQARLSFETRLSRFVRQSAMFPLTCSGEANTYSLFAELATQLTSIRGRTGQVLKTGIVNAKENVGFFQRMLDDKRLLSVRDFKNWRGWFPDVGYHERFSLVTFAGAASVSVCTYAFNCVEIIDAHDPEKVYTLSDDDVRLINPNVPVCPVFSTKRDAEITKSAYKRYMPLVSETTAENPWEVSYLRMFDMTTDSAKFRTQEWLCQEGYGASITCPDDNSSGFVPLLEGKHIHNYTHRFSTYEGIDAGKRFGIKAGTSTPTAVQLDSPEYEPLPRYWVSRADWTSKCPEIMAQAGWCIAFRDVTNLISNSRTTMAAIAPVRAFGNSAALVYLDSPKPSSARVGLMLLSVMNSVPFDFIARQKLFGSHLNKYILWQLPVPTPQQIAEYRLGCLQFQAFVLGRGFELVFVANSLQMFARACGYAGPPFRWHEERRFLVRSELDAAYFHLYGIVRNDVDYIMETFPIVKKKDIRKHGHYRTKDTILEIYDEMTEAMTTGKPYQTRLDPPPGPPADAEGNFLPLPQWLPGQPRPANWPPHIHPPREVIEGVPT